MGAGTATTTLAQPTIAEALDPPLRKFCLILLYLPS